MTYLHMLEQMIMSPLTQGQIPMLQKLTAIILHNSAFILHGKYSYSPGGNKQMYIANKYSCFMLKLTTKFGVVSDLLNSAMYCTFCT